jgi:asparagine synthase (glutamine-hydrolysing)
MCGIFGIASCKTTVSPELLERAARSLAHRGPDDSGTVLIRDEGPQPCEIGFAHRRLAILDLSPLGHQPMHDPETGNWIVFNGEIYNYRELRRRLEQNGARFRTNSDTEVLLKAFVHWGESCLQQLRGMFSFALWDASAHCLLMARDPMGIKPFYFAQGKDGFLFASEVRTLLETGLIARKLDHAGLTNYLQFGSVYDPNTMIEGIFALQPGHFLTWANGVVRDQVFWDFPAENLSPSSREQLESEVRSTLHESVCMQTVSDVPVGIFLSGGIDSSSLVSMLARRDSNVSTFAIVFRESEYSEAAYSRVVAGKFATQHYEILLSQTDALQAIPAFLQAIDQPTIDGFNTYIISREARAAGIKVALNGIGGDELFAGYSNFRSVPKMERFVSYWNHLPESLRKPSADLYEMIAPRDDLNRKLAELARENGRLLHPYFLSRSLFTRRLRNELLSARREETRASAPLSRALIRTIGLDPVNRVSFLESRCYMLNTLLRDADVMSMAHGLELRVPLIDHKLAESVFAMPGDWKLSASTPKPVLVNAVKDLPSEIVHRRKRGFTLPFEHWIRQELRSEVEDGLERLCNGPMQAVFDRTAVQEVWSDFCHGRTSWSRPWSLFVLQRWCEEQSVTA